MKNIVYLCSSLEQTGPTSQLFNIISGLDTKKFNPYIITLSKEKENSLKFKFELSGFPVVCLGSSSSSSFLDLRKHCLSFLKENNIDVVHSQGIRADCIMSSLVSKTNVNWIATLRNIPYLDYPAQYGKSKGIIMAIGHIVSLRKCPNIVVVSQSVKTPLQRFFSNVIQVIPNGIDTDFYSKSQMKERSLMNGKAAIPLSENEILILYTGVLEERKNLLPLLDVVERLNGFKLVLVGQGSLRPIMQEHSAVTSGKAILVGAVKDVRPYIALADVFILVSKAEGLPNSVLEALSMDCPAILSNIGPHKEIASVAKDSVFLIDHSDMNSLYSFLNNSYKEWRTNIKKGDCNSVAKNEFSSAVNSVSYQKLYIG